MKAKQIDLIAKVNHGFIQTSVVFDVSTKFRVMANFNGYFFSLVLILGDKTVFLPD